MLKMSVILPISIQELHRYIKMKFLMNCVVFLIVFSLDVVFVNGLKLTEVTSNQFDKTYLVGTRHSFNFSQAKDFCHLNGGQLAKIESRGELLWFDENIQKKRGLGQLSYWIGATPVGSGQTPTHWLDGTKIVNYLWQNSSRKTQDSDCTGLAIDTHENDLRFDTYSCYWYPSAAICELNHMAKTLSKIKSSIAENQLELKSNFKETIETIENTAKRITNDFEGKLNQFKTDVIHVKSNELEIVGQELTEKKSTILKLSEELKKERRLNSQCRVEIAATLLSLNSTERQLVEQKSMVFTLRDDLKTAESKITELRIENAVCSKSADLLPTVMSLSSTNDKLSSTIEQLLNEISKLKQNEKLLKQQLVDNE